MVAACNEANKHRLRDPWRDAFQYCPSQLHTFSWSSGGRTSMSTARPSSTSSKACTRWFGQRERRLHGLVAADDSPLPWCVASVAVPVCFSGHSTRASKASAASGVSGASGACAAQARGRAAHNCHLLAQRRTSCCAHPPPQASGRGCQQRSGPAQGQEQAQGRMAQLACREGHCRRLGRSEQA